MPKVSTREYRVLTQLNPAQSESKKLIDSDYYVEGYAARFEPYVMREFDNVKVYEQIDPSAFEGADMSDVIMQYDHEGRVMARTSNGTLVIDVRSDGLFIGADLSKSDASRELYNDIAEGLVTKMSWSFIVEEDEYDTTTRTRLVKKIRKVYDVSAVSIPANNDTTIQTRSYFDGVIEAEKLEKLERRKKALKLKALLLEEEFKNE